MEGNHLSKGSLETLNLLSEKLKSYSFSEEQDDVDSTYAQINETLLVLFTLLFEFTEPGMVKVVEKCGESLVELLLLDQSFQLENDIKVEVTNQVLLIISALCNYDLARSKLVESTDIMKICVDAFSKLQGEEAKFVAMRDKILSCLSTLVRGFVLKAVEAGIVEEMVALLKNEKCISDQKGAAGIILSLIEPEKGQLIGARVLFTGVVQILLETFARPIPKDSNANDRASHRNLQILGLRILACILRHQELARASAIQFFVTRQGEIHLQSIIEHAKDTSNVSRWLFAGEILMWLSSESSCWGLLGRLGSKQALYKIAAEVDPYEKWTTLINQSVSLKCFPLLLTSSSIFQREQHAFLALWMNRYTNGGFDVSYDSDEARSKVCTKHWIAFATTLLASPDPVTRMHANATLQGMYGVPPSMKIRPDSASSRQSFEKKISSGKSKQTSIRNIKRTSSSSSSQWHNYHHLLTNIGFEKSEEKQVIEALVAAKLPLHIILRSGINVVDLESAMSKLALGTKIALVDGIREMKNTYKASKTIVQEMVKRTKEKDNEILEIKESSLGNGVVDSRNPSCFISYCWAQKEKVKALKALLEDHGIRCWIDEQQLEGGSMLFEEIDDGISASSVIISCLSPEYTKSVNCQREFLLASDRKKTTIPVILEDLESWPPRGSMGPLLAGKLYIKVDEDAIKKREKSSEIRQLVQSVIQVVNTAA